MKITDIMNSTIEEAAIAHVFYLWHLLDAKREEADMMNKFVTCTDTHTLSHSRCHGIASLNDKMLDALNSTVDAKRDYRSPWGYNVSGYTFNPTRMKIMLQVDGRLKGNVNASNKTGYKHKHNKNIHR